MFKNCIKVQFCLSEKVLAVPRDQLKPANIYSWFTIINFYGDNCHNVINEYGEHMFTEIKIHTLDIEKPFLHIVCKDMELYHVGYSL